MSHQAIKSNVGSVPVLGKMKKPSKNNTLVDFVAGASGGTAGVFVTCPLDVVQTRLQSSLLRFSTTKVSGSSIATVGGPIVTTGNSRFGLHVICYLQHIARTEGIGALYKGLLPNLVGIAPSRAIYFAVYSKTKTFLGTTNMANRHSSFTHMLSALSASWTTSTITNPIWFLKTRLQLDLTTCGKRKPVFDIIRDILRTDGVRGFYRGLSASYVGASETMVYFVLYEKLKSILGDQKPSATKLTSFEIVVAAFLAKVAATISMYPHEVARTRLREDSHKPGAARNYRNFTQTVMKVYQEEKWGGLYGGMGAHLMRQVPNTVIMFLTYETIVNVLTSDDS